MILSIATPTKQELKRALAVMMWIEGVPCSDIQKILNVSATFVSQVKMKFIQHGVKELKLRYQGSKAYLSREQRWEIINYREDIGAGKLVVYMIDECHLLWGDVCGYVWGKTNKRIEVPMTNQREMRDYLSLVNQDLKKSEWLIICELFAPNAPEQNPVEDIWLQAKRFLRENWYLCKSFSLIKKLFMLVTHCQTFDFPKLEMYGFFSKNSELIPS